MVLRAGAAFAGTLAQGQAWFSGNSTRFDSSLGQHLHRTPSSAGNQRIYTTSFWTQMYTAGKTSSGGFWGVSDSNTYLRISFEGTVAQGKFTSNLRGTGGTNYTPAGDAQCRDNAWYHVCLGVDSTQATAADRWKLWINGVRQDTTAYDSGYVPQNNDTDWMSTSKLYIGANNALANLLDASLAEMYILDGIVLDASYFGYTDPLTGVWRPKEFTRWESDDGYGVNWSSCWSGTGPTHGTDGGCFGPDSTTTYGYNGSGGTGTYITFTPPTPISISSSARMFIDQGSSSQCTINGSSFTTAAGWNDITSHCSGTLTTIRLDAGAGSAWARIWQLEIDGVVLKDSVGDQTSYLPFDGKQPIGQDMSGKNNDWTPLKFGSTIGMDEATPGTLPILNTVSGGNIASPGVRTDANSANLVLALPLCGIKSDFSGEINSGTTSKVMTATNSVASNVRSNFYQGSWYFDGSGDYLAAAANSDFAFGTGDFTIEMWVYPTALAGTFWDSGAVNTNNNIAWFSDASGITIRMKPGSDLQPAHSASGYQVDKWTHMCLMRDSGTVKLYLDGVFQASVSNTSDVTATAAQIGLLTGFGGSYDFAGWIQDVKVYKGLAKYKTAQFKPASTDPIIRPESFNGSSLGSQLMHMPNGAVSFNNDDYLTVSGSTDTTLGSTDFTMECWVFFNDAGTTVFFENDAGTGGCSIQINGSEQASFQIGATNVVSTEALGYRKWYHLCVERDNSGGVTYCYVDGLKVASTTADAGSSTSTVSIGARSDGTYGIIGCISNARLVKGSRVYGTGNGSFTPPTKALTNVTNTKLLCCQSNKEEANAFAVAPDVGGTGTALLNMPLSGTPFDDDSSTGATVTNTGSISAASAGTNSFNITNAASLNGSSQRISTNNTNLPFDNVAWTFDIWFKLDSSASGYNALLNTGYGAASSPYMYIGLDDDEKPYIENTDSGSKTTASDAINKNQWYHMRVRSDGTNMRQYIDGELVVTKTCGSTDLSSAGTKTIGSLLDNGNNANNFHGLIGPVRYVSSDLGPPPLGGLKTSSGALPNSADIPDIWAYGDVQSIAFNPFDGDMRMSTAVPTSHCLLSQLDTSGPAAYTFSDGNLTLGKTADEGWYIAAGSVAFTPGSGKWQWEFTPHPTGSGDNPYAVKAGWSPAQNNSAGNRQGTAGTLVYDMTSGSACKYQLDDGSQTAYGTEITTAGTVCTLALDFEEMVARFAVNGVPRPPLDISGSGLLTSGDLTPVMIGYYGHAENKWLFNFGQKPFKYSFGNGYKPINIANTNPPGQVVPEDYFSATLYNGSSATTRRITGFAPDLVWIKSYHDNTGGWHCLDTVRGASWTSDFDSTSEQSNETGNFVSFDDNGVTVTGSANAWNGLGDKFCLFAWKAGGSSAAFNRDGVGYASAAAAGLDSGSINPTGSSVNTTCGLSILQYEGTGSNGTIAHGMGRTPAFIIARNLDDTGGTYDWIIYHESVGNTKRLKWANDTSTSTSSTFWQDTSPTDELITIGTSNDINKSGDTYILYAWANVPGLQQFGQYTGDNVADGPMFNTGFSPAMLFTKRYSNTGKWCNRDINRSPINPSEKIMDMGATAVNEDSSDYAMDIVATGAKCRSANAAINNGSVIYCAWAKSPFHNLYGASSNAR